MSGSGLLGRSHISQEIYEHYLEHAKEAVNEHTIHSVNANLAGYYHGEMLCHRKYRFSQ